MIVVTGATGQLGAAFGRILPGARLLARSELDLADPGSLVGTLARLRPTAVVNCAAYTAVDLAETEEDLASVINGTAVGVMAGFASSAGIPFVTFSSDYVFDGTAFEPYVESSPTAPIGAYGRSKLEGELLAVGHGGLVVRTSWLISGTHPNFVATMLRLASAGGAGVVDDQIGRPTIVDDLAVTTLEAMTRGVTGLLHLSNTGEAVSWFGLATTAVALAGLDTTRIKAISTMEYPTPAQRPAFSVLGSERLADLGIEPLPDWRETLPRVVAELQA